MKGHLYTDLKRLVGCLLLLPVLLQGGCASEAERQPLVGYTSETEQKTLIERDAYAIRRIGDHCYLDMGSENKRVNQYDGGCVIPANSLEFSCVADMYNTLMLGTLEQEDLDTVRHAFSLERLGFLIADPENFYDIKLPDGLVVRWISLQSDTYTFHIGSDSDTFYAQLQFIPQTQFISQMQRYNPFETGAKRYDSVTQAEDRNALVYDYTTETANYRNALYTIESDNKTLYVKESYKLTSPSSDTTKPRLLDLVVYGQDHGAYYSLYLNTQERPSVQWLDSFTLTPYDP